MHPHIKKYIENHIDDIDNNLPQFFVNAGDALIEEAIGDIIDVLEDAGIETTVARLNAVHQNLDYIFESFNKYGHLRQPLKQWLDEHLISFLCFDYPRIEDYILDNISDWSQWIKLEKVADRYIVTRS